MSFLTERMVRLAAVSYTVLMKTVLCRLACIVFICGSGIVLCEAADWPTQAGDSRRSGVSAETLTLPLRARWVHRAAHEPRPAWPPPARDDVYHKIHNLQPTTDFDQVYHPVVAAGLLYYGSSVDDAVYCVDAATGRTKWTFITGGPVRLAPTVAGGKVYAGSDDGFLYCLDAGGGRLLWKHRAGPEDKRLPGNGRMISLWPVRCGVVVENGTVYFAAGIFPSVGVYLTAVDAGSGKEMWKHKIGVSAQGYMIASPARLFMPTGRTPLRAFDRRTGKGLGWCGGEKNRTGGCYALLVDDVLVHSAGEKGGVHFSNPKTREAILSAAGLRVIAAGGMVYILKKGKLIALERKPYLKQKKTAVKWESPCAAQYSLVAAGDTIIAGGDGRVAAYSGKDGRDLWQGKVAGRACGLAVSGGRLFVSTDKGNIHCFGKGDGGTVDVAPPARSSPYPADRWTPLYARAAAAVVKQAGVNKGYCLVAGVGDGRLAYEIAKCSELKVVGVSEDAGRVAAARDRLSKAGVYGTRVVVHHARLDKLPYPDYFANVITSDETLRRGTLPVPAGEVLRVLRPCGGVVAFCAADWLSPAILSKWAGKLLPGWKVERKEGLLWGTARRGKLKGSGEWDHQYAETGNSACSGDILVKGSMNIQWFGRPGPQKMVDRHNRGTAPLFRNGRLFVPGMNYIAAVDAYNGTILWERDVPDSVRMSVGKNCGSMAATDNLLYMAAGNRCLTFDAQTGREERVFTVPASGGVKKEWGYVARVRDVLLGSSTRPDPSWKVVSQSSWARGYGDYKPVVCSDDIFAFNRRTGSRLWAYTGQVGVIINPTIAAGDGRLYFVESGNPATRKAPTGRAKLADLLGQGSNLVALDLATGRTVWKKPTPGLKALQHNIYLSYAGKTLVVTGTKNISRDPKQRQTALRYDLRAFDAETGNPLWQVTQPTAGPVNGSHGEQDQHPAIVGDVVYTNPLAYHLRTGKQVEGWMWQRGGHGCGTISASAACMFYRGAQPRMMDLTTGRQTRLTDVTRPGCWINIIPAGGILLIPEASSGCTCPYAIQTSIALKPK